MTNGEFLPGIRLLPSLQATEQFDLTSSLEECWKFVSNLDNVGHCIPGCEEVRALDDKIAVFKIKFKVGYLSRTFELKAKIVEMTPPTFMKFSGSGQDAEITGSLELSSRDLQSSIRYTIEIMPISATGKTALTLIGKETVRKQTSEFASCVKAALEKTG